MRIRRKPDSCRRMSRSGSVAVSRRMEGTELIGNTDIPGNPDLRLVAGGTLGLAPRKCR